MTPEERQAFIRTMVDQLAARLEAEPADPDGWLRLARSYLVLVEADKARAALALAEGLVAALPQAAPDPAGLAPRLEALRRDTPCRAEPTALKTDYLGGLATNPQGTSGERTVGNQCIDDCLTS